jgi:hypothetical protein
MAGEVPGTWRRSTRCGESTHCVEISQLGNEGVGLRNSTRPNETLNLTLPAFRDLVERVKSGELDR